MLVFGAWDFSIPLKVGGFNHHPKKKKSISSVKNAAGFSRKNFGVFRYTNLRNICGATGVPRIVFLPHEFRRILGKFLRLLGPKCP